MLLSALSFLPSKAGLDLQPPPDTPSIEALISLHKTMVQMEKEAALNINLHYIEVQQTKKKTINFNDVRTTLNTKLNNINSYLILASSITSTALELKDLIGSVTEFIDVSTAMMTKKPYIALMISDTQYKLQREIKHAQKLAANLTAQGLHIFKSSIDEQLKVVFSVKNSLAQIRTIITNGTVMCRLIDNPNVYNTLDIIDKLFNSRAGDKIVEGLVAEWNRRR